MEPRYKWRTLGVWVSTILDGLLSGRITLAPLFVERAMAGRGLQGFSSWKQEFRDFAGF